MQRALMTASLLLAASLSAQTGTYTTFGKGCPGSTGSGPGCLSANYTGTWGGNAGVSTFALGANSGTSPRLICGFEFYAATRSGNATKKAWIFDANASGAPNNILVTTSINWTATPGWHRAKVNPPQLILPNTKFFLAFENPGRLPYMKSGPNRVEHWHSGPPNWRGPYYAIWNYNILCCGSTGATPVLGNSGVPSITTPFSVTLDKALASSVALQVIGLSNTSWGPFKLPLDLTGAGASGCSLLVSFDAIIPMPTDANGHASLPYKFPNQRSLIGVVFHNQWIVGDKPANGLGLSFSNGGTGKIGS